MRQKVLNAAGMKEANKKKVLETLHVEAISREELSRRTGLTRAGISVIVDELLGEKLVAEGSFIGGKVGRKSVELKLNPDKYKVVGIAIARDYCSVGISDFECNIKSIVQIPLEKGDYEAEKILLQIERSIRELLPLAEGELLGIGITAPGPLDIRKGVILSPPNFTPWAHMHICRFFRERFDCPVIIENNAKAIALAEKQGGAGSRYQSYVEIVVDTGIGGGIVIDGQLYQGNALLGSEFGHVTVDIHGKQCSCGNRGCVEMYASLTSILAYAREKRPELGSWKEIVEGAEQGDPFLNHVLEREAEYLVAAMMVPVNILDPEALILAGEITAGGPGFLAMLEDLLNRSSFSREIRHIPVIPSEISGDIRIYPCVNLMVEYAIEKLKI